ncbi:uncharacterized protein LOC130257926 isoform X1 [Oenanthe melanoleuca]|uniref:uncharacterized protein LOC130257926 isoform X1 n=1 Tax=Oenanthe melanoleuca TaxID=2939378 RepID=UPI0024C0ECFA|nr:uncharacterized protein LOC130257926 isoform X1 [Oenanthe melanoleuca]
MRGRDAGFGAGAARPGGPTGGSAVSPGCGQAQNPASPGTELTARRSRSEPLAAGSLLLCSALSCPCPCWMRAPAPRDSGLDRRDPEGPVQHLGTRGQPWEGLWNIPTFRTAGCSRAEDLSTADQAEERQADLEQKCSQSSSSARTWGPATSYRRELGAASSRRRQCSLVIDSWSLVGASMLGYRGHRSRGASQNSLPASAVCSSWAPEAETGSCIPSITAPSPNS